MFFPEKTEKSFVNCVLLAKFFSLYVFLSMKKSFALVGFFEINIAEIFKPSLDFGLFLSMLKYLFFVGLTIPFKDSTLLLKYA